jgi:hypothetical protein
MKQEQFLEKKMLVYRLAGKETRTVSVYTTTYRTQRRGLHESGPWSTVRVPMPLVSFHTFYWLHT